MIKKAIISCAGFGTRFLPISKTIQKEMLPLLNRPVIDYIVEDCCQAGIKEFILVINEHNYQPLHYFRENHRLKKYLERMNKLYLYQQVEHLHQKAKFSFIKQTDQDPYGTSIPILLAQEDIRNEEAFLYMTGDDFVFYPDQKKSFTQELINLYTESGAKAAMSCIEVKTEEIRQYGAVKTINKNGWDFLDKLVEKPNPEEAPSNLANISKYILNPNILPILKQQRANQSNGEFYITDAIEQYAQKNKVVVYQTHGKFLNAGDPVNWLKANLIVAGADPSLRTQIIQFLQEEWQL